MKVYIDELPIGCKEHGCDFCHFAELGEVQHYIINEKEIKSYRDCVCKLDKNCGFKCGEKTCPLQSLSDYTKQVRKEAFEELYKFCEEHHFSKYSINEFLDQIQGD